MLTLNKVQNTSPFIKFEIWAQSILNVIQAFHTVRIVLYIRCSGAVVEYLKRINIYAVDDPTTGPEHPIYRTMRTVWIMLNKQHFLF